jgi:hypothetical protein
MRTLIVILFFLCGCSSARVYSSLSQEDASKLNLADTNGSQFQVEINPSVLREINAVLNNPPARAKFNDAARRLASYRSLIAPMLSQARLPAEFIVIPLVQTGYRNRIPGNNRDGAGIWRFTPFTANTYGLVTDISEDERLNPEKETHAVTGYFLHLYNLFHDWRFVVTAYCEGEGWIENILETKPHASPWDLEAILPDGNFCLSRTMADIFLLRHPGALNPL